MEESAQAAMSYVRSRAEALGLEPDFYQKVDVHVHFPEFVRKDGPSAGVTMATSLASALIKVPVKRDLAMTGEITLRGRVMPIGGLKEKLLAAHRSGITTVIVPKENRKDLREVPRRVLKATRIVLVEHMDEVLREALCLPVAGRAVRRRRASAGSTATASSWWCPGEPLRRRASSHRRSRRRRCPLRRGRDGSGSVLAAGGP